MRLYSYVCIFYFYDKRVLPGKTLLRGDFIKMKYLRELPEQLQDLK
jgi:hypothetical protein